MSVLNQKTIAALRAEMIEAETAEAEEKERLKAEAAATNPPIYSAAFLAAELAALRIAALPPRFATAFAPDLKSIFVSELNIPAVAGVVCVHFLQCTAS